MAVATEDVRTELARRWDLVLLAAVLALTAVGALLVWSAARSAPDQIGSPSALVKKDLLTVAAGLVVLVLVKAADYRTLRAYAPIAYGASCVALVAVLSPLGSSVKGHHSWIQVGGGFQLQPSEFTKVGLIMLLAAVLGELQDGEQVPADREQAIALGVAALPIGLVLLQPDLGTIMVLSVITFGMLALAGVQPIRLFGLVATAVVGALAVWQLHLLKQYQINRFIAFADPAADPAGAGYNARQAKIAVGSGGLFGQGVLHGQQTGGHFVPEQHTDFVFTVAGEELGFLGAAGLVLLLGVVLWRGLRIATACADPYGRLLATGVTCWFAFQGFENIGMTLGITPITGVPLPFVSYGGSATIANLAAIGILQSVHARLRMFS
ncbi:rod shape-determining protein RodA [Actinomadura harenae]|uniref:peptidoglycan glycosyltransferase n=1 Tax=Actinomadura harenae TaxID=2483351 RepID=A0A3M2M0S4_9ACTN|nr:rod shape-determining protein RodA [Actinomadura harenae]RMI40688.1 rod shape-determining protein RodA [Actinomadura harenae]